MVYFSYTLCIHVTLTSGSRDPQIGSRDPEVVMNVCAYLEVYRVIDVFVFEIFDHKLQVLWPHC